MLKIGKVVAIETSQLSGQQASELTGFKRFGKKVYVAIAAVIIVIIAAAFLIPQGAATIPLNVDYTVGEKMVYDSTLTTTIESYNLTSASKLTMQLPNTTSINAQETIEVMSFDAEGYLLNHTTTIMVHDNPLSFFMIEKMNKTGYSTYVFNTGNTETEVPNTSVTSSSYLTQLLNKPEAKVGDTITVPYPTVSAIKTTGNLTISFRGVEDLTTPSGTYKVFRVDMTSNDVSLRLHANNTSINMSSKIDINYQVYLEYGTLRQIKSVIELNTALQSSLVNSTSRIIMDMTLNQDIKP